MKEFFRKFVKSLMAPKSLLKKKIEEICSNGKLSVEEVNLFVYERLRQL